MNGLIAFHGYSIEQQYRKRKLQNRKTSILRGEGRVAEWLKAPDSKSGLGETLTWVRIPPLPPYLAGSVDWPVTAGRGRPGRRSASALPFVSVTEALQSQSSADLGRRRPARSVFL